MEFGSSNLDVIFFHFPTFYVRTFLGSFNIKSVYISLWHPGLFPWFGTDAKGERWWRGKRQKHWLPRLRVPRRRSSNSSFTFSGGYSYWQHDIRNVGTANKRRDTGFYCGYILNSVHGKGLNDSSSICFALATQCTKLYGSAQTNATAFCTRFFSWYRQQTLLS